VGIRGHGGQEVAKTRQHCPSLASARFKRNKTLFVCLPVLASRKRVYGSPSGPVISST
jgi:hypothetical protein